MKSILLVVVLIAAIAASACIIPDDPDAETPTPAPTTPTATTTPETPPAMADAVPRGELPESFTLRAVLDKNTEGTMDIIEEAASMVSGSLDVGEIVDAVQGIYAAEGEHTDTTVTIIECTDSVNAANAARNYKNQSKFENPPARTVSRFATANFNGHKANEVRTAPPIEDGDIRYGYFWSNGNFVVIVGPGTSDKSASMELARMTGY